jgi:hypothetical protein
MDTNVLHLSLKNLWHLTRECILGNFVPLPPYICVAFTNPEMTRRIYQNADLTTQVVGRCVGALVVTKLATDLKLKPPTAPAGDWEHACLATILGTESRDVGHCLSRPGIIELVNTVSIAFSGSLCYARVPSDVSHVLLETLGILLAAQEHAEPELGPFKFAPNNDRFKDETVSRLQGLFKMCRLGASPLKEEVRTSCLRMCLKVLWHCSRAYHQASDPLPTYFHLMLASPEISHLKTEQDPAIRMTGRCFGALVLSKLVNSLPSKSHVSRDAAVLPAHIWAILGDEHREDVLLPYQLHVINFRNVVSLVSGEIDALFPAAGMLTDLVEIAEQTLTILAERFKMTSPLFIPVSMAQRRLLDKIPITTNDGRPYRLKDQTVETLNQLHEVLKRLPE